MTGDTTKPVIELIGADIPRAEAPSAHAVVKEVDWRIEAGSFWAVAAFAGAGKTDLLLTAAGLLRPNRGELLLFGKPSAQMSEEELVANRLKVAMVFANGRLFSHLTLAQNISLPLEYHGELAPSVRKERCELALEQVGLADLASRMPNEVPRALHQRAALARALALSPEVLLVDNPLGAVDQRRARWWLDFFCAVHTGDSKFGRKLTVIVSTDDLRPWMDAAKEFGIIREGRFEIIGGRDQVKNTSEQLVRELLSDAFEAY